MEHFKSSIEEKNVEIAQLQSENSALKVTRIMKAELFDKIENCFVLFNGSLSFILAWHLRLKFIRNFCKVLFIFPIVIKLKLKKLEEVVMCQINNQMNADWQQVFYVNNLNLQLIVTNINLLEKAQFIFNIFRTT